MDLKYHIISSVPVVLIWREKILKGRDLGGQRGECQQSELIKGQSLQQLMFLESYNKALSPYPCLRQEIFIWQYGIKRNENLKRVDKIAIDLSRTALPPFREACGPHELLYHRDT